MTRRITLDPGQTVEIGGMARVRSLGLLDGGVLLKIEPRDGVSVTPFPVRRRDDEEDIVLAESDLDEEAGR